MPPPPTETTAVLQSYLEALRRRDRVQVRALVTARPDLTEDFAAIERALSRLGAAFFAVGSPAEPEAPTAPARPAAAAGPLGRSLGRPPTPPPEAPSQFLGALPEPGGPQARGPEALLERLDQHASSFERYADGREIARGGMGSIQRVWDTDLRRHLVMKVMLSDRDRGRVGVTKPPDARLLTRFLEEAQITAQLDHPGILPVHDIGVDPEGRLYFTMPLVIGQELGKAIEMMRQGEAGWTQARLLTHLRTAMEAVAFAHSRGVIHRDLKPENVMVGRFGETYVMDWGLARVLGRATDSPAEPPTEPKERSSAVSTERFEQHDSNARPSVETLDGDIVGTPGYMAPEQARGERSQVGPRADVYSMGAILYQVLTGHRPFGDPASKASGKPLLELILAHELVPIRKLEKNVPGELVAIAEKAMAQAPEARYASMIEMADDLRAFLEGRVVLAYERGLVARARKWVQRNQLASVSLGLALGGALIGTIAFIWQQQDNLAKLTTERNLAEIARQEALDKSDLAEKARADEARQRELAEMREEEAKFNLEQESFQRAAAERARISAEEQRALARQQSVEARQSAELARHSTYAANLLAAQLALSAGNPAEALRGLESCEPELRGFEWEHLRQQTDASRLSIPGHRGEVLDLAINPGEFVASSGADGSLRFWDSASGDLLDELLPARGRNRLTIQRLAVAPGRSRLALAQADGRLFFLEPTEDEPSPAPDCPLPLAPVQDLEFSPDGRWLAMLRGAAGFEPARLDLFDMLNNRWASVPSLGDDRPRALAWDPRGRRLALGCLGGVLWVLDVERGRSLLRSVADHRQAITGVTFDARGAALCSVAVSGALELYDVESGGQRLTSLKLPESGPQAVCLVNYAANTGPDAASAAPAQDLGPPRALVAVGGRSGILHLYDLDSGLEINSLRGHLGPITALAFDPLSESLVSSSQDGAIKYWNPYQSQATTAITSQEVAGLPGLLFAEQDRALITWRSATSGRRHDARAPLAYERLSPPTPLSFGPFANTSGTRLFAVSAGAPVELSSQKGAELTRGPASPQPVRAAALSTEGTLLALCVENRGSGPGSSTAGRAQALIFAIPAPGSAWERPQVLPLGDALPLRLALSSQKQVLIAEHSDGSLVLYQLGTGQSRQRVHPPALLRRRCEHLATQEAMRLAAALNGQPFGGLPQEDEGAGPLLLDARHDRLYQACGTSAWMWPLETTADGALQLGTPRAMTGHNSDVSALALSPTGDRLATVGADGRTRVWDPLLCQSLIELPGPGLPLCAVAFSSDGSRLATLSNAGELRLFETRPTAQRRSAPDPSQGSVLGAFRQLEVARQLEDLLAERQRGLASLGVLLEGAAEALTNPARTLVECWQVARDDSRDRVEYERALSDFEAALPRATAAPIHHRTRAALALRLGEPLISLDAIALALRAGLSDRPDIYAIQALAAARAGMRPTAMEAQSRAHELIREDFWNRDAEAWAWVREADAALAEEPASGPSGE